MGLLSFIKGVGEKIFGSSEAQAAPADELKKEAAKHGFDMSKVDVKVDGDKVTVTGNAMSQEEAEKMILAMGKDIRVVLIKLADRLHNMRTLKFQKEERRVAIARETLDIPLISMSMGGVGSLSRIMGWVYGSAATFAVGKSSSAPGQASRFGLPCVPMARMTVSART